MHIRRHAHRIKTASLLITGAVLLFGMASGLIVQKPIEADALSGSQFNPGRIIDDAVFFNKNTMSASQIQSFLNSKVPTCDTNGSIDGRAAYGTSRGYPPPYTCLKDYRQTTSNIAPDSGICSGYTGASNETSATIIYKVARSCGINPQVLLVMLQKEQSLVTDDWPWSIQYQKAMGAFCPDTAPCDSGYAGFFKQMYYGAHRLKVYTANPNSFNYRAGRNNTIYYHPDLQRCGSSNVYIQNQATANLYIYTPYRPNQAALNNLYGEGDSCSSYGNRNFWRMFNDWFGSTTTSILFRVNGGGTYYLEWGDYYYAIPSTEILKAYKLHTIAPRSVSGFPVGKSRGPNLQRVVKFGSDNPAESTYTAQVELVDGGKRHAAPNWTVLGAHGFNSYENYDPALGFLLQSGNPLRGVVRKPNGAIYLVQANKKRGFPDSETYSTLSGPNVSGNNQVYSQQSLTNMSSDYIDAKSDGAPMLLDGKIFAVSGIPGIYLYDSNYKLGFSAASYAAWGGKYNYVFSQAAANQITPGSSAPILIQDGSGNKFAVSRGKKHPMTSQTSTQWGLDDEDFSVVSSRALSRLSTSKQLGQVVTDNRPGVFFVEEGEKHGIPSLSDFSRLGLSWTNVVEVSSDLLKRLPRGADLYAPGSLVRTPNGAVFMIDDDYIAYGVPSSFMFEAFGMSWKRVINVTSVGLQGYTTPLLQQFVRDETSGKYYIVDKGAKREITTTQMAAGQYNLNSSNAVILDSRALSFVPTGSSMTRFIRGSGPTVFYIENGQRRPIASEASFFANGGQWQNVRNVSDTYMQTIPRGSIL